MTTSKRSLTQSPTCAARYGGTCTRPVSDERHANGRGCHFHWTRGSDGRREHAAHPDWAAPPAVVTTSGEPAWTPAWYDGALDTYDVEAWRAALAATDLPGVTVRYERRRDEYLVLTVPPAMDPEPVVTWALARHSSSYGLKVSHGRRTFYPHHLLTGHERPADLFGGDAARGNAWQAAARAAGLTYDFSDTAHEVTHLTDASYDLGLEAPVRVADYDMYHRGLGYGPAAVRALLEAADAGDTATVERAAAQVRSSLGMDDNQTSEARRLEHRATLATRPVRPGPFGSDLDDTPRLGPSELDPAESLALWKAVYPGRVADLDRAAAIVGLLPAHEHPTPAGPCAYRTAADVPCANVTTAPDRWCGDCARRPAADLTRTPLLEGPNPLLPPASDAALTAQAAPAAWTKHVRAELAAVHAAGPGTVTVRHYDEDIEAPVLDPALVKAVRDRGRIVTTYPHRWHPVSERTRIGLGVADRAPIMDVLRRSADPALLLSGQVAVRAEDARTGLKLRRTAREKEQATKTVYPFAGDAATTVREQLDSSDLFGNAPVDVRAVERGGRWVPEDEIVTSAPDATSYELRVAWTDGPAVGPVGAWAEHRIQTVSTGAGAQALHLDRKVSPTAVGMTALREHLAGDDGTDGEKYWTVREHAEDIDHPNVWGPADRERHPDVDPAWAEQVSFALGRFGDSGVELRGFLAMGGLDAAAASLGLDPLPTP